MYYVHYTRYCSNSEDFSQCLIWYNRIVICLSYELFVRSVINVFTFNKWRIFTYESKFFNFYKNNKYHSKESNIRNVLIFFKINVLKTEQVETFGSLFWHTFYINCELEWLIWARIRDCNGTELQITKLKSDAFHEPHPWTLTWLQSLPCIILISS